MADTTATTRYQQVADQFAGLIRNGTFEPGSRVPSLRNISRQMSVSMTTAMEAYRVLEERDLIEARPKSGFYVRCTGVLPPEPAKTYGAAEAVSLEIASLVLSMMKTANAGRLAPLGAAVPNPSFLPTEALNRALAREVRANPETSQSYDSVQGFEPLREQLARRALNAGCTLSPDEIITTNGAHQAVYLSLSAVTKPGDTVVVEKPTYVGLLQVLEALNLRALEVATDPAEGLCLECLEEAMQREKIGACVLVPSFGNPLGHNMPTEKRVALVEMLAAAEIPTIEDDVYGELYFDGERPRTLKSFDKDGLVLLCSSFSKTLAPGYRVGWVAPGRFLKAVEHQKYITSVATPTPTQMALAAYLKGGAYDRHLRRLRSTYCGLVARMSASVAEYFPPGTRLTRPRGGHVLWVEMPGSVESMTLYPRAIQKGISFAPGPMFSASGEFSNFMRLNCAVPWSDAIDAAIRTLGELAQELS